MVLLQHTPLPDADIEKTYNILGETCVRGTKAYNV